MSYKETPVDLYPYLVYTSDPEAAQANASDLASLDSRLDAIEASGWVTTNRIAAKAVTGAKVADATIDTGQIKDAAITTAKIADGAVTADKLAGDGNA